MRRRQPRIRAMSWQAPTTLILSCCVALGIGPAHPLETAPIANAAGATYYTAPTGNDGNSCLSSGAPCATIGGALAKAADGDTVSAAAGTYTETVVLTKNVTLVGAGVGQTVIDGLDQHTPITVYTATVATIAHLTVQHGNTSANYGTIDEGGGIYNSGTLTVADTMITGNTAYGAGGGLVNAGGSLTIQDSAVVSNTADITNDSDAGGIANYDGVATIVRSVISDNRAGFAGGGIENTGTMTIIASTISDNRAPIVGGISTFGGILTVTDSSVTANQALNAYSGGIYNTAAMTVTNSAITGNSAPGDGGGVYSRNIYGSTAKTTIVNSTIGGNNSGGAGGGIYAASTTTGAGKGALTLENDTISRNTAITGGGLALDDGPLLTIADTIVAANSAPITGTAPDCAGTLTSRGYNLLGVDAGCTGVTNGIDGDQSGSAAHPLNPGLGPLQDNGGSSLTMALLSGSAAIDAGNPGGCADGQGNPLTTDQRGMPRPNPANGRCDIGAYEVQTPSLPTPTPTSSPLSLMTPTAMASATPTLGASSTAITSPVMPTTTPTGTSAPLPTTPTTIQPTAPARTTMAATSTTTIGPLTYTPTSANTPTSAATRATPATTDMPPPGTPPPTTTSQISINPTSTPRPNPPLSPATGDKGHGHRNTRGNTGHRRDNGSPTLLERVSVPTAISSDGRVLIQVDNAGASAPVTVTGTLARVTTTTRLVTEYAPASGPKAQTRGRSGTSAASHSRGPLCRKGLKGCIVKHVTRRVNVTTVLAWARVHVHADKRGYAQATMALRYRPHMT